MLIIEAPLGMASERSYVLETIFTDWLGIPWQLIQVDRLDVLITAGDSKRIILPDIFFSGLAKSEDKWIDKNFLPQSNDTDISWDVDELLSGLPVVSRFIPIIFGDKFFYFNKVKDGGLNCIKLPVDIFGSAFFMLSRYEEIVSDVRDLHNRCIATESVAFKLGFIDRPIVDEYVEILWAAIEILWPGFIRKKAIPKIFVTCDVDSLIAYSANIQDLSRRAFGDVFKRLNLPLAYNNFIKSVSGYVGAYADDPFRNGIDWIMKINEELGNQVHFYFIPYQTSRKFDGRIDILNSTYFSVLREVKNRGHVIGMHPGYKTYKSSEMMRLSAGIMRRIFDRLDIQSTSLESRQHYLMWDAYKTVNLLEENGVVCDSTLGYADRPGYRCGTCKEFNLYDFLNRRKSTVIERPLILMECSVLAERYLGLGYTKESLELMLKYKRTSFKMGGNFVFLWHNSHLNSREDKFFYTEILR